MKIDWQRGRLAVAAVALLVAVATVVDAIRHSSWGPVWTNAWLPAVLVAALAPAGRKGCRPRLRGRAHSG